jgi:transposase
VDIENRYRMIIEPERSGKTISDICIAFGVSRETWYKWKRRYDAYGIDGLKDQSRKPHNVKNVKVTEELEKLILVSVLKQDKKCQLCWYIILSTMSGSTTSNTSEFSLQIN